MGELSRRRNDQRKEKTVMDLIGSMPGMIVFKDHDGHWLKANQTALDVFQLNGLDYVGMHDLELAQHSKNPQAMLHCITTDARAWQKGTLLKIEEQVGDTYWEVKKQPVYRDSGSKQGILVMCQDITEVKLVEQKILEEFNSQSSAIDKMFF